MTRVEWHGEEMMRKLIPSLNAGLTAAAAQMANQAVVNFGRDGNPSKAGGVPGIVSGGLRQSVRHASPETMGTPLRAAFGTSSKVGRWMEFGVTAKPGKALAIPVDPEAARKIGTLDANGFGSGSLRNNPNLVYIPIHRSGSVETVGVLANKSKLRVWRKAKNASKGLPPGSVIYVLRKRVAARPWIWKAALESRTRANASFHKVFTEHAKARGLLH